MTKDEALKLALETLECWQRNEDCNEPMSKILEAIKETLAQPEQERMADHFDFGTYIGSHIGKEIKHRIEDYSPPQRTWVGLTPADYEKLEQLYGSKVSNDFVFSDILCTVEAELKEKNT